MSIEKRGRRWAYRFQHDGEIYFKQGFIKASDAEAAEAELRVVLSNSLTFAMLARRRLEYVSAYYSKQHLVHTRGILKRFTEWNALPVALITKEMVSQKILNLALELTPNNVNRHIRGLRSLFNLAVESDFISRNPTEGIKFLPVAKKARVVPTTADIKEVLLKATPVEQAFITVVWQTAARVSEITHLTWEDVDFKGGTVQLWTRKARNSDRVSRVVPMLPDVRKALSFMWKNRDKDSPWVFTSPLKKQKYPNDPAQWHYGYRRKLIHRVTQSKFGYHALRHSTASTLAALKVEIPVIQKVLGHSRPTTTDIYLSAMPQGVTDGMSKLGDYLEEVTEDESSIPNRN